MNLASIRKCLTILLLSFILASCTGGAKDTPKTTAAPPMDAWSWTDPQMEQAIRFAEQDGSEALILVYSVTWCPVCQAYDPTLNILDDEPDITVVVIHVGETQESVRIFVAEYGLEYRSLMMDRPPSFVIGWPHTTIIQKQAGTWKIIWHAVGFQELDTLRNVARRKI